MATGYSDIIKRFRAKIAGYDLGALLEEERDAAIMCYLDAACARFTRLCMFDLTQRTEDGFTADLDWETADILVELMVCEWLKPKVYNADLFENVLNTRDFSHFSPANLLKEARDTLIYTEKTLQQQLVEYSHTRADIAALTKEG